jgi:hypothetical protein
LNELRKALDPYYREAEFWLMNAPRMAEELERRREEILHSSPPNLIHVVPGGKNVLADPTGDRGVKLTELKRWEEWLRLVREVEATPYGRLVRIKRELGRGCRGRPVWVKVAWKLKYSERRVKEMWREVVYYTAFLAVSRGITSAVKCSTPSGNGDGKILNG